MIRFLATALTIIFSVLSLHAATFTWDGGANSTNLNSASNWVGDLLPTNGDSWVFGGTNGTQGTTLFNGFATNGFTNVGITFNDGSLSYTMTGNQIRLNGAISNNSTNAQTFSNALVLVSAASFSTLAGGGNLAFRGNLSGSVGVTASGTGTVTLGASNSYTGTTTVTNGATLNITASGALGTNALNIFSGALVLGTPGTTNSLGNITTTIHALSGQSSSMIISNGAVLNYSSGNLFINGSSGTSGSTNQLVIASNGTLNGSGLSLRVGRGGGPANNIFTNGGGIVSIAQLVINSGGVGTNVVALGGGTTTVATNIFLGGYFNALFYGANNSFDYLNVQGGVLSNPATFLGQMGTNVFNQLAVTGGRAILNSIQFGAYTNSNAVNITNQVIVSGAGTLTTAGFTNSAYGLGSNGVASVILTNGGTLQASASANTNFISDGASNRITLTLTNGGGTIDSGNNAITISSAINGNGSLVKSGSGTLALIASNSFSGGTIVNAGTLLAANSNAIGSGNLLLNTSGVLALGSGGTNALGMGTLVLNGGILNLSVSGTNSDTLYVNALQSSNPSFITLNGATDGGVYSFLTQNSGVPLLVSNALQATNMGRLALSFSTNGSSLLATAALDHAVWNGSGPVWGTDELNAWDNYNPVAAGDAAFFGPLGALNPLVQISNAVSVGFITFSNSAGYGIGTLGSTNLTLNNNFSPAQISVQQGSHTISESVILSTNGLLIGLSNASSLTMQGNLVGAGAAVNASGSGTLILGGTNTFTGGLAVSSGKVRISNSLALGSGTVSLSSGALDYINGNFGGDVISNTLAGSGTLTLDSDYLVTLTASNSLDGIIRVIGANLTVYDPAALGSATISLAAMPSTLTYVSTNATPSTVTLGNVITGAGSFVSSANGTLTVGSTNNSSFTGSVTVLSGALNITTVGSLGSAAISLDGTNSSLVYSGGSNSETLTNAIIGVGSLLHQGGGTLVLTGLNGYSGSTVIASNAVLQLGDYGLLGYGDYTASVTNNGLMVLGSAELQTLEGVISGSGGLVAAGSGGAVLLGTNSYQGGTTVSNSLLSIGNGSAIGSGSLIMLGGGTLQTLTNAVFTNAVRLGGSAFLDAYGNVVSITAPMSGPGALTFTDSSGSAAGYVTLSGTNTYSGGTLVTNMILEITSTNALPRWNESGGFFVASGATLAFSTSVSDSAVQTMLGTTNFSSGSFIGFDSADGNRTFSNALIDSSNGALGLVVLGANTITLSGANAYTGNTLITSGTLLVTGGLGSGNYSALITNKGLFVYAGSGSQSLGGVIAGTGSLSMNGSGTLSLSAANTFTGSTILNSGTLLIANQLALQYSLLSIQGGTLSLGSLSNVTLGGISGTNAFSPTGSGTSLAVTLAPSGTAVYSGSVGGGVSLLINGSGTQILSGSNSYTGGTTLLSGTLALGNNNSLGAGSVTFSGNAVIQSQTNLIVTNQISIASGVEATLAASAGYTMTNSIGLSGAGSLNVSGPGSVFLSGSNSYAGDTRISSGVLGITSTGVLGLGNYAGNITIDQGATLRFSSTANQIFSGVLMGSGTLWKFFGGGTLTLTGANDFSGVTTVAGGVILLSNALALQNSVINYSSSNSFLRFGNLTNVTIGGLTGSQTLGLTNNAGNPIALTISTTTSNAYSGALSGGASLRISGTGTQVLSASNSYSGGTVLDGGTLGLGTNSAAGSGTLSVVSNGTLYIASGGLNFTNSTVIASGATETIDLNAKVFTNSGSIGGLGALSMTDSAGSGTLVLSASNSFSGGLNVLGGTLLVVNSNALGSGTITVDSGILNLTNLSFGIGTMVMGNGSVTGTGTLTASNLIFNPDSLAVISERLAGSAALTQVGVGTTVLSGSNTFSGGVLINAGTLQLSNASALGTNGSISFGGGTLLFSASNTNDYSSRFSSASDQLISLDTAGTNVVLASSLTSSNGTLSKFGAGTLTLSAANTFNGNTTVYGGTLLLNNSNSLQNSTLIMSGGSALFGQSVTNISIGGLGTSDSGSPAGISLLNAASQGVTLIIGANNESSTYSGSLSGAAGALTKVGTGTTVLAGTNTYGGRTLISGGVLQFDATTSLYGASNSLWTPSNITVSSNATVVFSMGSANPFTEQDASTLLSRLLTVSNNGLLAGSFIGFDATDTNITITNVIRDSVGSGGGKVGFASFGSGTIELSSSNSYSGNTLIAGGIIAVSNSFALGSGTIIDVTGDGGIQALASLTNTRNLSVQSNGLAVLDANGNTITQSGTITGPGGVLLNDYTSNGIIILSASNDFSGGLTLDQGVSAYASNAYALGSGDLSILNLSTLQLGTNRVSIGELHVDDGFIYGTGTITATSFSLSPDVSAVISASLAGTGTLIQNGIGVLTLSNANTYSGGTILSSGSVYISRSNSLGTGPIIVAGNSVLRALSNMTITNSIYLSDGTIGTLSALSGTSFTVRSVIDGPGGVRVPNSGSVTLSGTNTFTGNLSTAFGTLTVSGLLGSGNYSGEISNASTLTFNTTANQILSGAITGTGSLNQSGAGTLTLAATSFYQGSTTIASGRTLVLGASSGSFNNIANSGWLRVTNGGLQSIDGSLSGTGSLTVGGTGTLIQSASNSYTGQTVISGGTLLLRGTNSGSGTMTVNGGTYAGTGRATNSAVSMSSGTIAPGDGSSTGDLSIGRLTMTGGTLNILLSGSDVSQLQVTGTAALGGTVSFAGSFSGTNATYTFLTSTGTRSGAFATVTNVPSGYQVNYTSNSAYLQALAQLGPITATFAGTNAVITGGTTNFLTGVSNSAATGSANLVFTVSASSNLTGSIGSTTVTPQGSTNKAGLAFSGTNVGSNQALTFTVSASNATTSSGTGTVTVDVYDHAAGGLSTNSVALSNVIVGYAGTVSTNVGLTNSNGFRVALAATNIASSATNVTLAGASSLTAGSSTNLALTFAAGQGTGTYSNNVTVTYGDASSLNGALSNLGSQTVTVTQNVYGHAAGALSTNRVALSNVILGYAGTVSTNIGLTNSNGFRVALAATNIASSATNVTLAGASSLTAGSSTNLALTFAAGQGTGSYSNNVTLTYGDASSLNGATNNLGSQTVTVTQNVFDHASGVLASSYVSLNSVIVGYTNAQTTNIGVSNAAGFRVGLFTANASNGTVALGGVTNVAAGSSSSAVLTFATGQGTGTFTNTLNVVYGDSTNLAGALFNVGTNTLTVSGAVFDHAAGGLSNTNVALSNVIVGYTGTVSTNVGLTNSNGFRVALAATNIASSATNVTLAGASSLTAGSSTNLALTFAAGQGTGSYSNNVTLTYGDASSLNGATNNLGSQTVTVTQNVYDHASGSLSTSSIAFGDYIVGLGGTNLSSNLVVSNAVGFRVNLSATSSGTNATLGLGNVASLASGASTNIALTLSTNQAAGALSTNVTLTYGDASNLRGASTNVGSSTVTVTANIYDHASGSLSTTNVALAAVHVGYTNTQTNSIGVSNAVGFRVSLGMAGVTSSNNVAITGVTNVAQGSSSNAILTFGTGQGAGVFTNHITLTFADASTLAGASTNVGSQILQVSGLVYSGQSTWTAGSGNWTNLANWSALGGTPGLDGSLSTNDSATFASTGGTITLNTNAALNAITFASNGYSVAGSGTITLVQGSSAPSITTLAGSNAIANAVVLSTNVTVTTAAGSYLTLAGTVSGNSSLAKGGAGTLSLTASNSYTGGTLINLGTVVLGNANALGTGTVTVGPNGALDFSLLSNGTISNTFSGSGTITQIGEGTLTLGDNTAGFTGTIGADGGILRITNTNSIGAASNLLLSSDGVLRFSEASASNSVTNTITVASNSSGVIEHGTGTGTLTLAGSLVKNASTLTLRGTNTGVITISGSISGSSPNSDLVYDGGTYNVTGSNSYNGPTYLINGAIVNANAAYALPTANGRSALYLDQTNSGAALGSGSSVLNLGANQAVASLSGRISSSLNLGSSTLTIGTIAGNTTFAGNIAGTGGALLKDGTSTLTLSGNNTYSGGTFLTAGTIAAASTNALGAGTVSLQGGSLNLLNNLSIASLDWRTNAIVSLTPGLQVLNVDYLFTNSVGSTNGFTFDFGGFSTSGTNTIMSFASIWSGFTTNSFGVLGTTNWGFGLNANSLVAFYLAAGDITNSVNTTIATSQTNASLTVNGGVTTINQGVTNTSTNSVTITSGSGTNVGTINNMGGIVTPVLTVSAGVLSNASSGAITASNSMTLNNGTVYNGGTINTPNFTQNSGSVLNNGVLNASSNITVNAGFITNNGTIETANYIQNGGSVRNNGSLNASNSFALNNGVFANYGAITTPNFFIAPSATFIGQTPSTANLVVSGTLNPGPGIQPAVGNVTLNPTADVIIQAASTSQYTRWTPSGSVELGGTIEILPVGGFALNYGDQFDIFVSVGPIKGEYDQIIMPAGFRGRSVTVGDPTNSIYAAPVSYTQVATTQNQINVATALDSFIPATSGDKLTVSTALDKLTASQYPQAFEAIQPTIYQSLGTIAFNLANAQNMELNQRLWNQRIAGSGFSMNGFADNTPIWEGMGDGKSVTDPSKDILRAGPDNRWGLFVDGNGIFAQANSGNMLPGYNAQSGGVTAGVSFRVNPTITVGAYTGYEGTYVKYNAGSSLTDNSVRFGLFGTYGKQDGKGFYGNAVVGGAYNNYQVTRNISFTGLNRTANSTPGAGELDTMLAAGYNFRPGNWTFGPLTSLQYTYLGVNSFNETGAQSLNLAAQGWNTSSLLYSLGAQAAYSWQATPNLVVVPQVNLSWQHEFLQNPYAINSSLGGVNFANLSSAPLRDFLYTGVGVTLEFKQKWFTSFFYNAAAGNQDLQSQNIFWSFGCKF